MKASKDASRAARALFRASFGDGRLDPERVRKAVRRIAEAKPRGYLQILDAYYRLVRLEFAKQHGVIESAVDLDEKLRGEVLDGLRRRYGADLTSEFRTEPALLGGMRVKVGSDVWDGSVRARLTRLADRF